MNHELPFFSVIVPTHERPAQLRDCLGALAQLDYPAECFEVIVVDDGSSASPEEIIASVCQQVQVRLLFQKNRGPAAARNRAAASARGAFLAFTDDDCIVDPGWLGAFAAAFRQTPRNLLGGQTLNALDNNPCSATSQMILDVVYAHYNSNANSARFFASNNIALSAQLFRQLGGFDESFRTSEDRDFCDRWLAHGLRMSYVPEALINHAHPLTLRSLWKQHFSYGRGAWRFHSERSLRGADAFKPDLAFYFRLLRASLTPGRKTLVPVSLTLLVWSQLANTTGFLYQRFQPKRNRARATLNDAEA